MSQRTESVTPSQPQSQALESQGAARQSPEPNPSQEQAVADGLAKATEQEEHAREEARQTLKGLLRAFRQGEKAYRAGTLEAGRLCHHYLRQMMVLGEKRSVAVRRVYNLLAEEATEEPDVNRLIAVYHVSALLGEQVKHDKVPLRTLREFIPLLERAAMDSPQECWRITPGLEAQARELFAKATADNLSADAVRDAVRRIVAEHARAVAERKRQELQQAKAEAQQAQQATTATADEQARKAALEQAAQAQAKAQALEKAAKQAEEKASKAQAKAEKAKPVKSKGTPTETGTRAESGPPVVSVPDMVKPATAKNAADLLANALLAHPDPSAVLEHLLNMLSDAPKQFTPAALRVLQAGRLIFQRERSRGSSPSPAAVAGALTSAADNGAVAAVA